MLHRDLRSRQSEHQGQIGTQVVDALAMGPYLDAADGFARLGPVARHRTRWRYRRMRQKWARIGRREVAATGCRHQSSRARQTRAGCIGCLLARHRAVQGLRAQVSRQRVHVGQGGGFMPARRAAQRVQRRDGGMLAAGDQPDEAAIADRGHHAGHGGHGVHRHLQQHRTRRRRMRHPAI